MRGTRTSRTDESRSASPRSRLSRRERRAINGCMPTPDRISRRLLTCGVVGPPLFVIAFLVEGALRSEYSPSSQTVSELATGSQGWQQIANFLLFAVLLAL